MCHIWYYSFICVGVMMPAAATACFHVWQEGLREELFHPVHRCQV